MDDYIKGLNDPQREAVLHKDGPIMIIAGAGSGKTRVLTNRIAHLIGTGVPAYNILALTFTNKAAGEMRLRIEKIIGDKAKDIWMGTFHSVFAKILRFEADKIGYTSSFSIYDTDDSKSLIRSIVKERNLDDKVYKANVVLNRISGAKNRLISYREYLNNPIYAEDDRAYRRPEIGRIYKIYQERAIKSNAMDFDDLLFNTNILFRDHPAALQKYQQKFKYLLIDEFQDTNLSQYLIVRRLAAAHHNICVVGDDAQSIYAFRGADIQNILNFEKDYPTLQTIRLEQNYRSTKTIVKAANSLIAKNKAQLQKDVWTSNEDGNLIRLFKAMSDNEEGKMVAQSIFEEKMQHQLGNNDFAILYRTNAQSRSIEEALRKANIKYKIIGGLSFYQRREIKDLISYLRYTVNHKDEEALKRIINLPKRGIGNTTLQKVLATAYESELPLWEVISNIRKYVTGRATTAIAGFAELIKKFEDASTKLDAFETASLVAKESGLLKDLYEDKTIEGLSRYENVQELLNAIKEFVDNPDNQEKDLSAFLQEVSLATSADEAEDDGEEKVTLMTIHAAKGLEFQQVYVVGLEEELFPSQMALSSRNELEEERRLFYVAITRAEKKLTLSFATSRYQYGRIKNCEPSRFLKEIDPRFLEQGQGKTNAANHVNTSFVKNLRPQRSAPAQNFTHKPSPNFKPSDTRNLQAGMKVEHLKFGLGMVKAVKAHNNDRKAVIAFEKAGEKTLLLSFAKLKIHE
ncbi:ATP-dependent helicase [Microscilla marina]|uniref:DNA 3'-5' helicase n=1 Tax=Microscilla marina ATCC 23134 TaxID=313606 RepID=A1ZZ30_MICM2|nr:UvrD-helicase domain-containing protein [Microscilla marina]EAY24352.1 ATP-dependent DNA helicase PcrA [Microscilla marina ATCC 23134]